MGDNHVRSFYNDLKKTVFGIFIYKISKTNREFKNFF